MVCRYETGIHFDLFLIQVRVLCGKLSKYAVKLVKYIHDIHYIKCIPKSEKYT